MSLLHIVDFNFYFSSHFWYELTRDVLDHKMVFVLHFLQDV